MNRRKIIFYLFLCLAYSLLTPGPTPGGAAEPPDRSRASDALVYKSWPTNYEGIKDYHLYQEYGVGAATWGEDVPNPFNNLTDEQRLFLQTQKVDIKRLQKMRAVVLTGHSGQQSVLLNWDPNIILVLGRGPYSVNHAHPDNNAFDGDYGYSYSVICSAGPIIATENSVVGHYLIGADLVWFQGHSNYLFELYRRTGILWGSPVLISTGHQDLHNDDVQQFAKSHSLPFSGLHGPDVQHAETPPVAPHNFRPAGPGNGIIDLRATILKAAGTDVTSFGRAIPNPFSNLTNEAKATLKARGIDLVVLANMRAILISGQYTKANTHTFINKDPNVIMVFDKSFATDSPIYSLGPILATGNAILGGGVIGANLVWYTGTTYLPLPGFALGRSAEGHPVLVTPDLEALFQKFVVNQTNSHDTTSLGSAIPNPFGNLTEEGKSKLKARGIDPASLTQMRTIIVTGNHLKRSFVNHDPNLIMVLDNNFSTEGGIYSLGPILVFGNASYKYNAISTNIVWFVGTRTTGTCGNTYGKPVIISPDNGVGEVLDFPDVWHGDYGWRPIDQP